eukprot:s2030_g10.t1
MKFQHQEHFVACIKKVCTEVTLAGLPYLMNDDGSIPILKAAMAFTAHDEALVRTQARSATLTLFAKLKKGECQLLHIALDMAKSMMLGSVSAEQPSLEQFTSFSACGFESALKVESSFAEHQASDISAALAMRTLAVDFPQPVFLQQELLALTEQLAAGALEDCTFIPKEGANGIPPTTEEVEALTKDRLEHLELASHAILEQMHCTAGIPVYPELLKHTQLLEDSQPAHVAMEDPVEFSEPAMPTSLAEAFAWIFKEFCLWLLWKLEPDLINAMQLGSKAVTTATRLGSRRRRRRLQDAPFEIFMAFGT